MCRCGAGAELGECWASVVNGSLWSEIGNKVQQSPLEPGELSLVKVSFSLQRTMYRLPENKIKIPVKWTLFTIY